MEPIFGFALYIAAAAIVWIVASKRGRPGWAFFLGCLLAGPAVVMLVGAASGGSGVAAGIAAFLVPIVALVIALAMPTSEQAAVQAGSHGDFKKCPFCAESIRKEAVKCKHCGSAVS